MKLTIFLLLFCIVPSNAFIGKTIMSMTKGSESAKLPTWTMNSYGAHGYTTNPNNIKLIDGNVATSTGSAASVYNDYVNIPTGTHGFTIPTTASITGIKVTIRTWSEAGSDIAPVIYLLKGGAQQNQYKTYGGQLGNTETIYEFGGPEDMWDTNPYGPIALTPADVNANGFGVVESLIWGETQVGAKAVYTDYILITVYYTEAP